MGACHVHEPRREMQDIQKGGDRVAGGFTNLGLLDKRVVKKCHSILLLIRVTTGVATLCLFSCCYSRNVESHLDQLVLASSRLLSLIRRAIVTISFPAIANSEFNGNFVTTRQVGVGDFGVRNLEGGAVLDIERYFRLAKLCFSPIPTTEGVLLLLEVGAVPVLEDFAETFVVLSAVLAWCFLRDATLVHTSCWKPSSWMTPEFLCKTLTS